MQNKNIKETIEFKNIDLSRASNGTIEKKFAGGSSGGYYIGIEWRVNSQSTSSNSSNVTATTYIRSSGNGYTISSSASKTVSITIEGQKDIGNCTVGLGTNARKNLISKTMNVGHDSSGNKTCSFACALDINVTLGGTYYGKVSHSGSGTFNQINLNSAPSMSGSLNISPNGTVPENTSSLTLSWNRASDAQNNVSGYHLWKYVNNQQVWNGWIGNVTSYNDPISSEGQGSQIHYVVQAKDSYGAWSNQLTSAKVTKNKFVGASIASFSSNIVYNTNSFVITLNKASNTNGNTSFNYYIYSDEITIYNAREITGTTETITIWKSGATPSTPYIKFEDLKTRFNNSGFNGKLQIGVRTTNAYGTRDWKATTISVDLRTQPTPATPSISQDVSLSTALVTIATTNNKYFIPNTGKKIRITWSGGSDILGQTLSYEIQVQLASGGFVSKQTTTNTYYDLELPKQSSTQNLVVRVITRTSYNYTAYKDTPAITLHYYNPPSVSVVKVDRTDTTATAKIKLNANTSIPNVNFTTRTYAGVSSGTLQNTQNEQSITASNLSGGSKYAWTITINDDTKLNSSNVTSTVEVPAYTPLFSVREKGVGINAIPDGSAKLIINGKTKTTDLDVSGRILASTIGQNGGTVTNFNNNLTEGEYVVGQGETIPNAPYTGSCYGKLIVKVSDGGTHNNSNNWIWQYFMDTSGGYYKRNKTNNGAWTSWVKEETNIPKSTNSNYKNTYAYIGNDGVMEVGKYIDFHNHTTNDYDSRITCDGDVLTVSRHLATGGNLTVGGTIIPQSYISLPSNGGSWLSGATNGNLRGYRQSTGSYHPIISQTTSSGHKISLGGLGDDFGFHLYDASRTENGIDKYFRYNLAEKKVDTDMRFTIYDNWLYTTGNNGWYNSTYGGGWYMKDSSWVRSYNDKNIYTGGRIKTVNAMETRYIDAIQNNNLDISANGTGTIFFNMHSGSGVNLNLNKAWSGSSGTEPSFYNTKGNGWGYIGNSGYSFYRVYGAGGSVSDRNKKYHITRALEEEQYENLKNINIYNYRTVSTKEENVREIAESTFKGTGFKNEDGTYKTEELVWNNITYEKLNENLSQEEIKELRIQQIIDKNPNYNEVKRQDLMLGAMVDELPTEVTFYDNEGGNGKAVDMYSYTTMIAGATKHLISKVEDLERENEFKENRIYELEQRLDKMEELLNGIINKG